MPKKKEKVRVIEQQVKSYAYTRHVTLVPKVCPVCQSTYEGLKISRFCSRACQQKANYERHAAQYREARMARYRAKKP